MFLCVCFGGGGGVQAAGKELVVLLDSMMGASTCISKKLNSKASIGFDNITDMLRFLALSTTSSAVNPLLSESWLLSFFNGDGPDTFAGRTARTLQARRHEYFKRLGLYSVWPLKLGSDNVMDGPIHLLNFGVGTSVISLILQRSDEAGPTTSVT